MPSKMPFLFGVSMIVGSCAILWIYWNRPKKPKKKIFISADCWLSVFDLITPSQLGHGIAMISHRFDIYVDEHFKTRKWALKFIRIESKIGGNGTKEIEIVNSSWKALPIPQIQLPRKVIGFNHIVIFYIDRNVITFLHRFRPIFASYPINFCIYTTSDRILEFILRNIWPMIAKNFRGVFLYAFVFHRLRQIAPSILNDFPSLRIFSIYIADFFAEFPADDNAMASDGQAVAKWLFTPRSDNVPKIFNCELDMNNWILASRIEAFKTAFASASSPVNFIVAIWFDSSSSADSVVPFNLTNKLTREQLVLKRIDYPKCFMLIRCPIARDASKWKKWEEEAIDWDIDQLNRIEIRINDEDIIGDGLLDATLGSIDQQQK